ncbi:hypothetical protein LCGC14_1440160 [marine sediment metagenome]|uniref:Uncharacterized protein n=1 Tax=marine sediment metagenome TaxID=412755 RepID=A0A0F9K745_9ZZZZ
MVLKCPYLDWEHTVHTFDFNENSIENSKFRLVGVHSDIACALINIDFNKLIGGVFDIYQF